MPSYAYKVVGLVTYDDVPPMNKLLAKVQEFNAALGGDVSTANLALGEADVGHLEQLLRVLSETSSRQGG